MGKEGGGRGWMGVESRSKMPVGRMTCFRVTESLSEKRFEARVHTVKVIYVHAVTSRQWTPV